MSNIEWFIISASRIGDRWCPFHVSTVGKFSRLEIAHMVRECRRLESLLTSKTFTSIFVAPSWETMTSTALGASGVVGRDNINDPRLLCALGSEVSIYKSLEITHVYMAPWRQQLHNGRFFEATIADVRWWWNHQTLVYPLKTIAAFDEALLHFPQIKEHLSTEMSLVTNGRVLFKSVPEGQLISPSWT